MVTIESLRYHSGKMTQEQLAKELGVTQPQISKWEKNQLNISSKYLIKLSLYFNVPVDDLIGIKKKR